MTISEAIDFIRPAIPNAAGTWADLGAGDGIFLKALDTLLPSPSTLYAVDRKTSALEDLKFEKHRLHVLQGDFTQPLSLPSLDGILMANALHFVPQQQEVLLQLVDRLKYGGSLVLAEYDTDQPNPPWVPYPIPKERFAELAEAVGLQNFRVVNSRTSRYGHRDIYLAIADKPF
ncbi:MAG TPA: hypothetical protein DCR93_13915 [Cytophagales bacterium]|nr:hypothetical protein [Cytophagales bacterium]HAP60536.1 hypothetical protein [Cytophagales bacterium]